MDVSSDSELDECEYWDEDCVIVKIEPKYEVKTYGFHLMITCTKDPSLEPPKKQSKQSLQLRQNLTSPAFIDSFQNNWKQNTNFIRDGVELITDPFRICIVQNILQDESITSNIIEEFNNLIWNKRNLDLYEFFQSADLKHLYSKHINILYEFLKYEVKNWIHDLTMQELTDISATCSLYGDTDYLLLHDDKQEDRLIAFVFYFTGPRVWQAHNGGLLQLFSKDKMGQPLNCVRNILPLNNQFVFFQVTNDSFHEVSEVLNKSDCRMSINGWFHAKILPSDSIASKYVEPNNDFGHPKPQICNIDLESWINSNYLDNNTVQYIQKHIEENSEISLRSFFKQDAFNEVLCFLKHTDIRWTWTGPPNRRLYELNLEKDNFPGVLQRFIKLFHSQQMFTLLKRYTDLDLSSMKCELQRWGPGCYSLLSDYDWNQKNELDLIIFLGCTTKEIVGGRIMYVSTDEEIQQALITLEPEDNNLNIIFRDTARFVKYISKHSLCHKYYVLICSYSE